MGLLAGADLGGLGGAGATGGWVDGVLVEGEGVGDLVDAAKGPLGLDDRLGVGVDGLAGLGCQHQQHDRQVCLGRQGANTCEQRGGKPHDHQRPRPPPLATTAAGTVRGVAGWRWRFGWWRVRGWRAARWSRAPRDPVQRVGAFGTWRRSRSGGSSTYRGDGTVRGR